MTSNLEIADLQKKLAEVEAELDLMKTAGIIELAIRNPSVSEYMHHWERRAEAAEAKLAKVIKKWSAAESEAYDLRAAIPCAYQMVLDAAAERADDEEDISFGIRAIQPPADLVERAKGGE